jgi:hypothetical protein
MSQIRRIIIRPIKPVGRRVLRIDTKIFTESGYVTYIGDDGKVRTVTVDEFNKGKNITSPMPTIIIDDVSRHYTIEIDETLGDLSKTLTDQLEKFWYKHHNIKEYTGTVENPNLKSTYEFELLDENVIDEAYLKEDSILLDARSTFMAMDVIKQKQAAVLCGITISDKSHKRITREMASLKTGFICSSTDKANEFISHLDILNDKVVVNTYLAIEIGVVQEHQGVYTFVGQTIGRTKGECALFMKNNPSIYNQMVRDSRAKNPDINLDGDEKKVEASKGKGTKVLENAE